MQLFERRYIPLILILRGIRQKRQLFSVVALRELRYAILARCRTCRLKVQWSDLEAYAIELSPSDALSGITASARTHSALSFLGPVFLLKAPKETILPIFHAFKGISRRPANERIFIMQRSAKRQNSLSVEFPSECSCCRCAYIRHFVFKQINKWLYGAWVTYTSKRFCCFDTNVWIIIFQCADEGFYSWLSNSTERMCLPLRVHQAFRLQADQ